MRFQSISHLTSIFTLKFCSFASWLNFWSHVLHHSENDFSSLKLIFDNLREIRPAMYVTLIKGFLRAATRNGNKLCRFLIQKQNLRNEKTQFLLWSPSSLRLKIYEAIAAIFGQSSSSVCLIPGTMLSGEASNGNGNGGGPSNSNGQQQGGKPQRNRNGSGEAGKKRTHDGDEEAAAYVNG